MTRLGCGSGIGDWGFGIGDRGSGMGVWGFGERGLGIGNCVLCFVFWGFWFEDWELGFGFTLNPKAPRLNPKP